MPTFLLTGNPALSLNLAFLASVALTAWILPLRRATVAERERNNWCSEAPCGDWPIDPPAPRLHSL